MVSDPKKYGKQWQKQRLRILNRDSWTCQWCGVDLKHYGITATVDHVQPLARGGDRSDSNCVAACSVCNYSRNNDGSPPRRAGANIGKHTAKRRNLMSEQPTGGGMAKDPSPEVDKPRQQRWKMDPGGQA